MNKVIVSVPGKIHLMGEHAVVYGKPAILTAINLRLTATIESNLRGLTIVAEDKKLVKKAIEAVMNRLKLLKQPNVTITINSQLPAGRHVGSSAALSVATVAAVTYFSKKIWNPDLFNELAYEVEKFQHGQPSGGDNSICTFGGFIWYRKEFEFLKNIWQLPFKPAPRLMRIDLIDTGAPKENTGEMVMRVGQFIKQHPKKAQELLDTNEQATKEITLALKTGDEKLFMSAMKKGERTLEGLGAVSEKAKTLIRVIEKAGGSAKILGGGGFADAVGLILCYAQTSGLAHTIAQKFGYRTYTVLLGAEGVRLEK